MEENKKIVIAIANNNSKVVKPLVSKQFYFEKIFAIKTRTRTRSLINLLIEICFIFRFELICVDLYSVSSFSSFPISKYYFL